ncbi:hypothetical protein EVAR_48563_1 [Eumeta japonica]|uniref:Uncharacterized protein n=1 Tax=Eumeta variegata TaxID=151549 RepID=A0A4C1XF33_EUMVA|nr:hypothetical protein EVAR_48563_1 [Eumeta japonica]
MNIIMRDRRWTLSSVYLLTLTYISLRLALFVGAQGKPDCWRGDACRGDESPRYARVYIQSTYNRLHCVATGRHAIQRVRGRLTTVVIAARPTARRDMRGTVACSIWKQVNLLVSSPVADIEPMNLLVRRRMLLVTELPHLKWVLFTSQQSNFAQKR